MSLLVSISMSFQSMELGEFLPDEALAYRDGEPEAELFDDLVDDTDSWQDDAENVLNEPFRVGPAACPSSFLLAFMALTACLRIQGSPSTMRVQ